MMKNTSCHPSLPSEFFSIGNSEFRMSNLEAPSLMETKMSMHNNGYCFQFPRSFPADNNWLRDGGGEGDHLDFSDHHILELQHAHECMTYSRNITHLPITKLRTPPPPAVGMRKTMEPPLLADDKLIAGEDFGESSVSGNWKKSKRKRAVSPHSSSQCRHHHHLLKEYSIGIPQCRVQLPVRRSQKIGDKITALQKLVSPYGKTDTASVLQEACIYIKLLQDQIQMLTNSYSSIRGTKPQLGSVHASEKTRVNEEECQDLRSRGLCLVPISSVREVAAAEKRNGDTTA